MFCQKKLEQLIFDFSSKFNQPLEKLLFPSSLKSLYFEKNLKQSLLTDALKKLLVNLIIPYNVILNEDFIKR